MTTRLSLAVAAKGPVDGKPFWQAVRAAADRDDVDIHVAHDDPSALVDIPPSVTAHPCPSQSLFALWGVAVRHSRGDHVAILHLSAPPAPGWLEAIVAALSSDPAIVCGPVEADYDPSDPRWIGYLAEYVQFHRPVHPGTREIPGNNLVIRRDFLVKGDAPFSKTRMLGEWAASGLAPVWNMDAVVIHRRALDRASYRRRRFHHGRAYGADRARSMALPARLLLLAAMPALPALRVWRIMRHAWRIPRLRPIALRWLGAIVLCESCWAAGEATGYLLGPSATAGDHLD